MEYEFKDSNCENDAITIELREDGLLAVTAYEAGSTYIKLNKEDALRMADKIKELYS